MGKALHPLRITLTLVASLVLIATLGGTLRAEIGGVNDPAFGVRLAFGPSASTSIWVTWGTELGSDQVVDHRIVGTSTWTRVAANDQPFPAVTFTPPNCVPPTNQTIQWYACATLPGTGFVHAALLDGLTPGARYEYRVGNLYSGWTPTAEFRTAPASSSGTVTFSVYGDSAPRVTSGNPSVEPSYGARNAQATAAHAPAFHLHLGDLSYADDSMQNHSAVWNAWFAEQKPLVTRTPTMWALGNHEARLGTDPIAYMRAVFPQDVLTSLPVASFRWGDVVVVAVWSNDELDDKRTSAALLDAELARADYLDAKWRIVTMHSGAYATGYQTSTSSTPGGHGSNCGTRVAYSGVLAARDVDVVLAGHDHNYQRTYPIDPLTGAPVAIGNTTAYAKGLGVTHVVAGSAGKLSPGLGASFVPAGKMPCDDLAAQIEMENEYTHVVVTETAEGLTFETHAWDERVLDQFTIVG